MAANIDPTDLAENARCLQCGLPPGMEMPVLIYLFCKIANVNPDPTELAEQARCLQCGLPPGIEGSVLIYLAAQIAAGSAGPGTGTFSGTGSPEGIITAGPGATYLQTDTSSFWSKETGTGNTGWIQLIA